MVKCFKCDWVGREEDLGEFMDNVEDLDTGFRGCPNCKTDEYLIDGWIKCDSCGSSFRGEETKEDTCPNCLRIILEGELKC